MTRAEWFSSADPVWMLANVPWHITPSPRRLRLAACSALRLRWGELGENHRRCVLAAESHAAGLPGEPIAQARSRVSWEAGLDAAARACCSPNINRDVRWAFYDTQTGEAGAAVLLDAFGDPFEPLGLEQFDCQDCLGEIPCVKCEYRGWYWAVITEAYRTEEVRSLALAAWQNAGDSGELESDRLLVLSDALEEAGCEEKDLLEHLRGRQWCHACDAKGGHYSYQGDDPTNSRLCGEHWYNCHACGGKGMVVPRHTRACWAVQHSLGWA